MVDMRTVGLFAVAALALSVVPSPVVLFTVICSPEQGREPGLVSTLATGLGDFCHVLAATAGLSALLLSSSLASSVAKYASVAYLLYLGVRTLLSREDGHNYPLP